MLTLTFLRIKDRLRSVAAGITGNHDEAEDVLNDAFCKLWSKYPELENEIEAAKLSFTVVRNSAIAMRRHNLLHPVEEVENISDTIRNSEEEEEEREKRELYDSLLAMASKVLKPTQYQIFIMHDVKNYSYPEIAARLEMTQINVRQQLSRARKAIREEFRKIND